MKNKFSSALKKITMGASSAMVATNVYLGQAFALNSGVGDLTGKYRSGIKAVVGWFGGLVGLGLIVWAVFSLILAARNEDSEGRNKAILNLVCGAALTAIGVIIALFV